MTDQDQPDFNMGIEAQLFVHEGEDFSSSGDEAIINIKETEASINKDMNIENQNRFQCTTVEERDLLLSEAEAVNTKKATKAHALTLFWPSLPAGDEGPKKYFLLR